VELLKLYRWSILLTFEKLIVMGQANQGVKKPSGVSRAAWMTLGTPLMRSAVAGCQVPVDRCQRAGESARTKREAGK